MSAEYPYDWPVINIENTLQDNIYSLQEGTYPDPKPGESNWGSLEEEENEIIKRSNAGNDDVYEFYLINDKYQNGAYPYKLNENMFLYNSIKEGHTHFKVTFKNDISMIFAIYLYGSNKGSIYTKNIMFYYEFTNLNVILNNHIGYIFRGNPEGKDTDVYIRYNKENKWESNIDFGLMCYYSGYKNYGEVKNISFLSIRHFNASSSYDNPNYNLNSKLDGREAWFLLCGKYKKEYVDQLGNPYLPNDNDSSMKVYRLKRGIGNMPFITYIDFEKELESVN